MHKRFLSSIGRRPSRFPSKSFPQKPRIAANRQEGQESEKATADGDSPEASVSRGVVSSSSTVVEGPPRANFFIETVLRVRGPKQSSTPRRLCPTVRLLTLKQGRGSPAPARNRRGRRVKSKRRIRSCHSNTKVSLQRELPASLRTIQCDYACTDIGGQSGEEFYQKY